MRLTVADLSFSYNSHPVLSGVGFELPPGRILGVLGVNGAGKSTLLKSINRILRPRTGVVMVDGRDVGRMSRNEAARRFGYVPQQHTGDALTVFDTVLLGRKPYIKWAASEQDLLMVERILERLGLAGLARRTMDQLSGGERQKVIIARALVQEPDVMILDEPTSNLDLKNQLQVMGIVSEAVRGRNISAVVSLHDVNLALRFADDVLTIQNGRIRDCLPAGAVTADTIREVYGVEAIVGRLDGYPVVIPVQTESVEEKT